MRAVSQCGEESTHFVSALSDLEWQNLSSPLYFWRSCCILRALNPGLFKLHKHFRLCCVSSLFSSFLTSPPILHILMRDFRITSSLPRKIISSGRSRIILNNIPEVHIMISPWMASWDLVGQEVPNPIEVCFIEGWNADFFTQCHVTFTMVS